MPLSIDHATRIISVPQSYLTPMGGTLYEMDVNQFRLDLKNLEDDADGMPLPDTHRHNTSLTLAGAVYARTVEIINGFRVKFEDATDSPPTHYTIKLTGANNNISDVAIMGMNALISQNSAGLVEAAGVDAMFAGVVEGNYSLQQSLRLIMSTLLGKVSGAGTTTITFRDTGDVKDRVVATVTAEGNRTSLTLDAS